MKLLITSTCVVKGGKIKERGQIHDTGEVDKKEDREAYDLIASSRAVEANSAEAKEILSGIEDEKAAAAAAAKAAAAKK